MITAKRPALITLLALLSSTSLTWGTSYRYDDLNRLNSVTYDNGSMIWFEYDAAGNRLRRVIDADTDTDGVPDAVDNCPATPNPNQADADSDMIGDICDLCAATASGQAVDAAGCSDAQVDGDSDGFCNPAAPSRGPANCMTGAAACAGGAIIDCFDNCPTTPNPDQADPDTDGPGSACDNCPVTANPDQANADSDGVGDVCDLCPGTPTGQPVDLAGCSNAQVDSDSDGFCNPAALSRGPANCMTGAAACAGGETTDCFDNCPTTPNLDQADPDADRRGSACDNCPVTANADQANADSDAVGDVCDLCPGTVAGQMVDTAGCSNAQVDGDSDGFCNPAAPSRGPANCITGAAACAGGAIISCFDNCPAKANATQADSDGDAVGNVCDNCSNVSNVGQADADTDGKGDPCDNCPTTANADQRDCDGDGMGSACEPDCNTNGVGDDCDLLPLGGASEWWSGGFYASAEEVQGVWVYRAYIPLSIASGGPVLDVNTFVNIVADYGTLPRRVFLSHGVRTIRLWQEVTCGMEAVSFYFDDEGPACQEYWGWDIQPVAVGGQPLAVFDGLDAGGEWTLIVETWNDYEFYYLDWSLEVDRGSPHSDCDQNGILDECEAIDTDADGVIDTCDACSDTIPGAPVDSTGCPPLVPGDFGRDGDVDDADLALFDVCDTGAAMDYSPLPAGCTLTPDQGGHIAADFDADNDVDLDDFGILQRCMSGEDNLANPGCALGCPDVCNPACSNYDPCTCSPDPCNSECPGYDQCDPSCPGYDPCVCNPDPCNPGCPGYDHCFCNPDPCDPGCPGYDPCMCGGPCP